MLAALLVGGSYATWFVLHPLAPPREPFDFTVKPGASLKSVANQLFNEGLLLEPFGFWILGRAEGRAGAIQAGTYRLDKAMTPGEILEKLARGDVIFIEIAFIEGTTWRQWLEQLKGNPKVKQTIGGRPPADVLADLGITEKSAEGWLFPDTYRFAPGTSDLEILRHAHGKMTKRLAEAWESRDPKVPLKAPYDALILASIVEKETAVAAERPVVASVFFNRMRIGMRLQTDPTVIYGMGASYDGNIRKKDLTADTPWNTYTRDGLPPTPIAMPGGAAIQAALHPAESDFLYFVARGDGSHQFSKSLEEHNRAVAKYQLKR